MKSISNLICLILFFWAPALIAKPNLVDKEKIIEHTYSISSNDAVYLDNQFGNIEINHWSKNEVKIYVVITASGTTADKAQQILDNIHVSHRQSSGRVSVETKIDNNSKNKNNDSKKTGFNILYTISMPNSNPLNLKNSFGDIELDDHSGEVEINLQFGNLSAGKLSNLNELDLQFGKGEVDQLSGGHLNIQFSSIDVNEVTGDFDCKLSFCKNSTFNISSEIDRIDMVADHSTVEIRLPNNLSAEFNINTSFGKLKNNSGFEISDMTKKSQYGPTFDHEYKGSSGSGDVDVRIKSSFSTVTLE